MAAVPSIGRASLVERSRIAPQAATTEGLYERHAAKLQSYCLHQLGSREEAEDAVQTTYMNAFRALGRGIVPEAESAWLFKIAENVCLSRRRSSWRRGRIESPSDFEIIEEIIPGPSRQNDELIGIEDALASMPEQQRRAILLREWQGLSYREIAEELEVTQSAVETLIFRARRSLAAGLEQPDSVKKPKRKAFRRALHAFDIGTIATAFKALLAGSAAVKATTAAVVVTAAASPSTASRRSSRSRRFGQRRRRRRSSASPRPWLPRPRAFPHFQLGPRCRCRTEACGQARRGEAHQRRAEAGRCGGREALRAAALHSGRSHARPGCAGRAGSGRRRAGVDSDFSSRGTAGRAAAGNRGHERQQQAERRAGAAGRRARGRDDRDTRAGLADEGRARRGRPHGDDRADASAGSHHEPGSGARRDRGTHRSDSGRHDAEHDEGPARAQLRN